MSVNLRLRGALFGVASLGLAWSIACSGSSSRALVTPRNDLAQSGCPKNRYAAKSPEQLALIGACNDADGKQLTLSNYREERIAGGDASHVDIRVTAREETCDKDCPRDMEMVVKTFLDSTGEWQFVQSGGTSWAESKDSILRRERSVFESARFSLSANSFTIQGTSVTLPAELTPSGKGLFVCLLVQLQDGTTALMAGVPTASGLRFTFGTCLPEDDKLNTLTGMPLWRDYDGQTAKVLKYRVAMFSSAGPPSNMQFLKTDWTPVR